ncbi:hypothetical protein AMTRI_Chr06g199230 [Amborella trichopoda]
MISSSMASSMATCPSSMMLAFDNLTLLTPDSKYSSSTKSICIPSPLPIKWSNSTKSSSTFIFSTLPCNSTSRSFAWPSFSLFPLGHPMFSGHYDPFLDPKINFDL